MMELLEDQFSGYHPTAMIIEYIGELLAIKKHKDDHDEIVVASLMSMQGWIKAMTGRRWYNGFPITP